MIRPTMMLVAATLVAGCDTLGNPFEVLGAKRATPDEFLVIARAPLQMPATRSLPTPRLGEVSRLDPTPERDAVAALLGPGAVVPASGTSAGERELLAAANAASADSAIRSQLEVDAVEGDPNKPYEAPSIFALVLGDGDTVEPTELLEPKSEARRLQTEGVAAAPIDPTDAVAPDVPSGLGGVIIEYDTTQTGGRPNNKLPVEGTAPAFE